MGVAVCNKPENASHPAVYDAAVRPLDGIPFHPYYTVHDIMGVAGFLLVFSAVVFFAPEMGLRDSGVKVEGGWWRVTLS